MHYLIFISLATKLFTEDEINDIVIPGRKNNAANNVTGLLLYSEGVFMQIIEGSKTDVAETYKRIAADTRHKKVVVIVEGEHDTRTFPGLDMAYSLANKDFVEKMEGYMNDSKTGPSKLNEEYPAINVLKIFAENNNILA